MTLYPLPQPLGKGNSGIQDRTGQNQKKLLPAVPADAVDLPRLGFQELREFLEHRVAGLVTVVVVHALEFVDVANDERDGLVQPRRMLPHLVQSLLERPSVVDAGQSIGERYRPQLVVQLRKLPLPDGESGLKRLDPEERVNPRLELGEV